MKLLIDAGNTRIKWALVKDDAWLRSGVVLVAQASELSGVFVEERHINQVWASNVAGEKVARHIREVGAGNVPTHFIRAQPTQCGVRNSYADPAQLGSDRWASLIAAWHQVRGKCLVVNCGTAITIDALNAQGEFVGGLIVPGIELMQRSLTLAAEQLGERQARPGQAVYAQFPVNTADAMYSGSIQAACGAIERQHALLGDNAAVVLSGGAAEVVGAHLNLPLRPVDNLVLQGLLLISQESEGS